MTGQSIVSHTVPITSLSLTHSRNFQSLGASTCHIIRNDVPLRLRIQNVLTLLVVDVNFPLFNSDVSVIYHLMCMVRAAPDRSLF